MLEILKRLVGFGNPHLLLLPVGMIRWRGATGVLGASPWRRLLVAAAIHKSSAGAAHTVPGRGRLLVRTAAASPAAAGTAAARHIPLLLLLLLSLHLLRGDVVVHHDLARAQHWRLLYDPPKGERAYGEPTPTP